MTSVELFAGAGGLSLGLEAAGFHPECLFEYNKHACDTLRRNRPDWDIVEGDVRNVQFSSRKQIDLVAGGPPCQPFSMGGKAKGRDDSRDMFPEAVRAVRSYHPRAFLFENVRGILRPAFSNYVEYIRLQLTYPDFPISDNATWESNLQRLERHHTGKKSSGLEYNVTVHQADAADFGVPQRRHRVFFIGFRSDVQADWCFPSQTHSFNELLRSQFVDFTYWNSHNIARPHSTPPTFQKRVEILRTPDLFTPMDRWQTVRDAISDLPSPKRKNEFFNHRAQPGARSYPGHTGSPFDLPSKALKAGDHGVPGGENMLRHQNGQTRYFTVRESARIQTFPDDFEFIGSWSECMRQLGNAVPVRLGTVIAESIRRKLGTSKRKTKRNRKSRQ